MIAKEAEVQEVKEDELLLRDVDREEFEFPSTAYGAKTKFDKDGNVTAVTLPSKGKRILKFAKPGGRVGAKRLYTVKAEKANGSVVQVPMEGQINNNVASPENFIGLRHYEKRGMNIFFDYDTGRGAFCPTLDCWAKWNDQFAGFCCPAHREITAPEADSSGGAFGQGATTSRNVWSS